MPTHHRGTAQERAALDAYIKLMRAADSVTARLDPLMRAASLTVGQFGALEALLHRGRSASGTWGASSSGAAATSRWWSATSPGAASCAVTGDDRIGDSSRSPSPTRAAG